MQNDLFYRLGKFIYSFKWYVLCAWLVIILASLPIVPHLFSPFESIGFIDPNSQSAKADNFLKDKLGYGYNRFIIVYNSKNIPADSPIFNEKVKSSLSGLKNLSTEHQIIYPSENKNQIAKNNRTAYAVVMFKGSEAQNEKVLKEFKKEIKKPSGLSMQVGGEPIFLEDVKNQTQTDLFRAEFIAIPVAIITMLIVFGSVVAACVPIGLGGIAAFLILVTLYFLGKCFALSVFTLNIALLLGLCLSLDYALLIISRYRDELKRGENAEVALAITQATAGKAVFFSGLAVLISLSALLFFKVNVLLSVGVGGIAAVLVAVAVAIILLPAVLAILNKRINTWTLPWLNKKTNKKSYWRWLVVQVVTWPKTFLTIVMVILFIFSFPMLNMKIGISDFRILPETLPSRQTFDIFEEKFGESQLAPIFVIVKTPSKQILTTKNIDTLYDYSSRLAKDSRIKHVASIVNTEPRLSKSQYAMIYSHLDQANNDIKKLLKTTTHKNFTVLTVTSKYPNISTQTEELIEKIRSSKPGSGMSVSVTGSSVNTIDVLKSIGESCLYAFIWIVGFTYLILLVSLRSVILPLKAIISTGISLCASYGLLVFIFQYGYFHQFLNFEPQHMLDITLLIIIFCALFGISMDYEVFLLSRIKEYYEQTNHNVRSIIFGIDRSSRIITSAAIIVILLCFSFMSADVLIVKAFGFGIAVAVFVDAFLIRTILVPATMALLGKWNWYLPKWLDRILPKISYDPRKD